jgi:chemotaxis protein CheD
MKTPPGVIDIFLQPGDFYFGDASTRIRTVLGSCISITMWHPVLLIGGMCHYMLPSRRNKEKDNLQGKYADEALQLFLNEARRHKTDPKDYQIKLFGGGSMFANSGLNQEGIPKRNIDAAQKLLAHHNLTLTSHHIGLTGHRNIIFDIWTGHVWVRYQPIIRE